MLTPLSLLARWHKSVTFVMSALARAARMLAMRSGGQEQLKLSKASARGNVPRRSRRACNLSATGNDLHLSVPVHEDGWGKTYEGKHAYSVLADELAMPGVTFESSIAAPRHSPPGSHPQEIQRPTFARGSHRACPKRRLDRPSPGGKDTPLPYISLSLSLCSLLSPAPALCAGSGRRHLFRFQQATSHCTQQTLGEGHVS